MSQEGASKPLTQGCFDLAILRYSLHFALESRGPNGRRTEHQIGRGVPYLGLSDALELASPLWYAYASSSARGGGRERGI